MSSKASPIDSDLVEILSLWNKLDESGRRDLLAAARRLDNAVTEPSSGKSLFPKSSCDVRYNGTGSTTMSSNAHRGKYDPRNLENVLQWVNGRRAAKGLPLLGLAHTFDSSENAINPNARILKISKQISDRYPFTINADQTEIHFTLNQNSL